MERQLLNSIKDLGPNGPLSCVRGPGLHFTSFPNPDLGTPHSPFQRLQREKKQVE